MCLVNTVIDGLLCRAAMADACPTSVSQQEAIIAWPWNIRRSQACSCSTEGISCNKQVCTVSWNIHFSPTSRFFVENGLKNDLILICHLKELTSSYQKIIEIGPSKPKLWPSKDTTYTQCTLLNCTFYIILCSPLLLCIRIWVSVYNYLEVNFYIFAKHNAMYKCHNN